MAKLVEDSRNGEEWDNETLSNAVNVASRITDTAPGGTIHLSDDFNKHCGLEHKIEIGEICLPRGGTYTKLGKFRLKGVGKHVIWQINPYGRKLKPR